jgi:hypothetical protein
MTTDNVPTIFGGRVNVSDMKALAVKAQAAAMNNPRTGGAPSGSDYLNFSGKKGVFTIGKDNRQIESDERWLVNVTSFEEGYVCWKNRKPESTRLANIYTGVPVPQPDPEELGPFNTAKGEGWYQAKAMVLKSIDEDQQGYFKINSVSGVGEMADLMEAFSERAAAGEPCWPVVCLDVEEFEAQGFKNFKPIFEVQGWLTNEQLQELADGADIDDLLGTEKKEEPVKEAPPARARARARG